MKRLTLVRHAKSSWADSGLDDFDRPLNARGNKDAPRIAEELKSRKLRADKVYLSPARRAIETFSLLNQRLGWDDAIIEKTKTIYEAAPIILYSLVRNTSDDIGDLVIVGHNPGLSDLAYIFLGRDCPVMVTCSVIQLSFNIDSWTKAEKNTGAMEYHVYPKMLDD